ncbi:hypothetical protein [Algivirga pacifica]|uniref:Uncharacterized protein n=1 Tax=Algivirga pacifica TaxID=1162670 RepID=A0ABP9D768_9BACT
MVILKKIIIFIFMILVVLVFMIFHIKNEESSVIQYKEKYIYSSDLYFSGKVKKIKKSGYGTCTILLIDVDSSNYDIYDQRDTLKKPMVVIKNNKAVYCMIGKEPLQKGDDLYVNFELNEVKVIRSGQIVFGDHVRYDQSLFPYYKLENSWSEL